MKRLSIVFLGILFMSNLLLANPVFTESFEYEDFDEALAAGWNVSYGNAASAVSFVTSAPNSDGVTDGSKALMIDTPGGGADMGISRSFSPSLQREWSFSVDWYFSGTSTGELPETGMRTQAKVTSSVNDDEVGLWVQYNNDGNGVYPRTLDFLVKTEAGGNTGWVRIDKLYNEGETPTGDFPFAMISGWNHIEVTSTAKGDLDEVTVFVNGTKVYTTSGAYGIAMDEVLFGYWHPTYTNKDGYFDNLQMLLGPIYGAHNPDPGHSEGAILPSTSLTWEAGLDPQDLTQVNPAILKHYVWMTDGSTGADDLTLVDTIDITDYTDPSADAVYVPGSNLIYDTTYYWMVEEGIDNGKGGVYPPGDPNNNISGSVWSFTTVSPIPEMSLQPVSVRVDPDAAAVFNIEYSSLSSVSNVLWYKNGSRINAGGDISIDWDQAGSTLTIANADASDEGEYYAIVTNSGGNSDPTDTVKLAVNRLLAWYQFEQNANDTVGVNDGIDTFGIDYVAGKITDDSQAYAADPNGTDYVMLTTDAYPKAGFGNGLDAFTYSCWVNLDEGEGGIVLGVFNDGMNTALRFSINSAENDISVCLRQEGNAAIIPSTAKLATDGKWHFVSVTYDSSDMILYVDGISKSKVTGTLTNFADWQYPMTLVSLNYHGSFNNRFSGKIDDLKIFNYALTKEDVAQAYLSVEGGWICDPDRPELAYDFDNNCQVDLADFALFAGEWLDSNRIYAQ